MIVYQLEKVALCHYHCYEHRCHGAKGTFSELAGEMYRAQIELPDSLIIPLISAEKVLSALQAAEDLAAGVLPNTTAVIAPRQSATLYGLEVLEEFIQDLKFNYTTFVVAK